MPRSQSCEKQIIEYMQSSQNSVWHIRITPFMEAILSNSDLGESGRQMHLLSPSVLHQNLFCGIEMAYVKKKKKEMLSRLQNNCIVILIWEEMYIFT